jgi:outer membrane protein OmpA-like peptidoglycan-associated protein
MQVATAQNGQSIAVWIHGTGSYNTVYARQIAADGTLGPIIPDLTTAGNDANRVQVAMDPDGNATLVWGWQDGPSSELAQTRRIASDGTVGPTQNLTVSVATQTEPQVVVDRDGVATIVYGQQGVGGDTTWTVRMAADGTLGTPHQLSASPGFGTNADVDIDPQGRATVAWVFFNGGSSIVQSLRIDADGTIGTTHDLVAPAPGFPQGPRVAVAGDGSATVAWERFVGGGDSPVQAVRIAADETVGSVLDISQAGADASQPRIGADDDGDTTLAWTSIAAGFVRTAKVVRLSADGTLGTVFDLATPAVGGNSPDVAVDPNGVATIAWIQQNSGDRVRARSMSADGVLGTTHDLSQLGAGANLPRVAVDPRGNAIVVWEYDSTSAQMALSERGFLRAVSSVSPVSDPGLFDLQLGGVSLTKSVGDGGDTGLWAYPADVPTSVGETAAAPTSLSDYATTIGCRDDDGAGSQVASAQNPGPLDVTLDDAEQVRCDVANTRTMAPPPPTFTSRPAAISSSSNFVFVGETGNSFTCSIDGGAYASCASPFTPTGLSDSDHTLAVVQHDSADRASSAASATWRLDTTAPLAPTIVAGPLGAVVSTTAVFEFGGEPGGSYECRLDGSAWSACLSGQRYRSLKRGGHRFAVRQIDAAGNVGGATEQAFEVGAKAFATPTRLRGKVGATAEVIDRRFSVGCRLDRGAIRSCAVRAYAVVADGRGGARRVYIGSGRRTLSTAAGALAAVSVKLNARGRGMLRGTLAGVETAFRAHATAFGSSVSLRAKGRTRLFPPQRFIVPDDGLFASDSATLKSAGQRFLRHLGEHLRGVGSLECVGFTDSLGAAAYNERLGYARARTVCDFLAQTPAIRKAKRTIGSQGENRPRASNATAAGRALNRRVELTVRY